MRPAREACFFVSDLHGSLTRYESLMEAISADKPAAVFLGGDLLPGLAGLSDGNGYPDFFADFLIPRFTGLKAVLGDDYPRVFLILGNDDPRAEEPSAEEGERLGLWDYCHNRRIGFGEFTVYGYSYVPPTPFLNKDWERYDVSRYVDPGCVSPEEGRRTVPVEERETRWTTIKEDLALLTGEEDLSRAILLCHTPPYDTKLDRAALDGVRVDHVPADVHVGSIALRELIEKRLPRVVLSGHIHEAARLTGDFRDRIGETTLLGAAHDGPELALVRFNPANPAVATRELR